MAPEFVKVGKYNIDSKEYLAPGHTFCTGCGEALAIRLVCKALGENTIIGMATGCDEVCTSPLPVTSWRLPWLHTLFENAGAEVSGMEAGLKAMMRKGKAPQRDIKFVAMAGDGGTSDIGLQSRSVVIVAEGEFLTQMVSSPEGFEVLRSRLHRLIHARGGIRQGILHGVDIPPHLAITGEGHTAGLTRPGDGR